MEVVYQQGKIALSFHQHSLKYSTTGIADVTDKVLLPNRELIGWSILEK